jgi:hypothetical protein
MTYNAAAARHAGIAEEPGCGREADADCRTPCASAVLVPAFGQRGLTVFRTAGSACHPIGLDGDPIVSWSIWFPAEPAIPRKNSVSLLTHGSRTLRSETTTLVPSLARTSLEAPVADGPAVLLRCKKTEEQMVTPDEMRLFALECLRWSEQTDNAGHRDLMIRVAKTWMTTASALEDRADTHGDVQSDLRTTLD